MTNQVAVNEKGFTVLYEALDPKIEYIPCRILKARVLYSSRPTGRVRRLTFRSVVFVHGFTGHPRDTWTWLRSKEESKKTKKHGRDEDPLLDPRFKIPKLSFGQSSRNPSTAKPSTLQSSRTQTTEDTSGRNSVENEEREKEVYWPANLARRTIPNSRILTYGYDTKIRHVSKGPVSQNTVHDHAWDLLCSLQGMRRSQGEISRPILFVAHSLGGIVVKEALRKSRRCASTKPHLHAVFEHTVGFLFFGTPHRGADPRNFFHHALTASAQILGFRANPQIVKTLMPDAEQLMELRDEFSVLCHERKWLVYSFQEEYGIKELLGTKVVDDTSSCLDDPMIETKRHISSNHMDMCRFYGLQDQEYLKVAAAMTLIVESTESSTPSTSNEYPFNDGQPRDASFINQAVGHEQAISYEDIQDVSLLPETQSCREKAPLRTHGGIDTAVQQSLVEQLYFPKIDERLTSLTAAQGKTCRWFLTKEEYTAWRNAAIQSDDGGFLWIKGNPGTGKSTLMKFLFEDARSRAKDDPSQITLSFFFLARGTIEEKSIIGLYRSLLFQLFENAKDLTESLEWMTANGARSIQQNGWNEGALKQTLMHAVSKLGSRSLAVFVDALDECDQTQVAGMVSFFEELCDHAREVHTQLQICFSSRHYPTVAIEKGVEITLEVELGHTEDIQHYIKSKLRLGRTTNAESLRSEVLEKSSGIFLWVVLVLDILNAEYPNSSVSINAIRKRLEQIPPGLNDLFEMILERDGKNLEQMHACLQWILFATRPLKPQELYFAVQLCLNKKSSTYWDQEDVGLDQMKTFVTVSSKGLAEVTRKLSNVQFIHESVRDFLLGRYGGQWSGASGNFEGYCHSILRDCCFAQFSAPIQDSVNIPDQRLEAAEAARLREDLKLKFPFLEYSVLSVLRHADNAQQHKIDQGSFLDAFPLLVWANLNNALERHTIRRYKKSVNLLYILAENNLAHLIRIQSPTASWFDVGEERYGPPVFAARATGSYEAIDLILESLRGQIQRLEFPLQSLWEKCCQSDKRIDYGRGFNFSRSRGILSHLAEQGDETMVAAFLLSSNRVRIDAEDKYRGWTPLLWAAKSGHEAVVRLLVDRGASLEAKDNTGRTPLSCAAESGHKAVVQLLVDRGAELEAKDNYFGQTPLLWAAKSGHEAVVQLLVDRGADLEAKDNSNQTPLLWAAKSGHEAVVQLLVDRGADLEAKDNYSGRTPLSCAASSGHEAVVQLLVDRGASLKAKDNTGQTPLSYAAESGHKAVVQLLVDRGASLEAKDNTGRTPLSCAASRGHEAVVQLLVDRGAGLEAKDNTGRTPLSWAAENGRKAVVRLLVDRGAELEAKDNTGQTPLSYAAESGHEAVMRLLKAHALS